MQGCCVKNTLILSRGVGGGGVMHLFGDPYREYKDLHLYMLYSKIKKKVLLNVQVY